MFGGALRGLFSHAYICFRRLERDVLNACLHPKVAHQLVTGCCGCCNFHGKRRYFSDWPIAVV